MTIKKGDLELQKNRTERLEIALVEIEDKKANIGANYVDYLSFVDKVFEDLKSYQDDLTKKIIGMIGNQKEEYKIYFTEKLNSIEVKWQA